MLISSCMPELYYHVSSCLIQTSILASKDVTVQHPVLETVQWEIKMSDRSELPGTLQNIWSTATSLTRSANTGMKIWTFFLSKGEICSFHTLIPCEFLHPRMTPNNWQHSGMQGRSSQSAVRTLSACFHTLNRHGESTVTNLGVV